MLLNHTLKWIKSYKKKPVLLTLVVIVISFMLTSKSPKRNVWRGNVLYPGWTSTFSKWSKISSGCRLPIFIIPPNFALCRTATIGLLLHITKRLVSWVLSLLTKRKELRKMLLPLKFPRTLKPDISIDIFKSIAFVTFIRASTWTDFLLESVPVSMVAELFCTVK